MKTLKKQIEERFSLQFNGHPSRKEESDIKDIKWAIIKLAEQIDIINFYSETE